jgi:hypothetical protein
VAFIATVARSLQVKFGVADVQAMKILGSAPQFPPLPNVVVTDCGHNNDLTGRNRVVTETVPCFVPSVIVPSPVRCIWDGIRRHNITG